MATGEVGFILVYMEFYVEGTAGPGIGRNPPQRGHGHWGGRFYIGF
jgi:hypothetical protein